MAINVSFNGATIYKPGAYSKTSIDLSGNVPLGPAGFVAIFGEADAGAPGSAEPSISANFFTADTITNGRAKYRSGPIVDALNFLFSPSVDGAIPNGASAVYVYKTNASVRAFVTLANSYGTVTADEWGVGGNQLTYKNTLSGSGQAQAVSTTLSFSVPANYNGISFTYAINGGAASNVVTLSSTPADHDSLAHLVIELNALSSFNTHLIASAGTGSQTGSLVIKSILDASAYQKGYSTNFELIDSTPGNLAVLGLVVGIDGPVAEPMADIVLSQKRDNLTEESIVGGNVVLEVGNIGAGGVTSASVTVTATQINLITNLGTTSYQFAAFTTLGGLVSAINLTSGWSASVPNSLYNQLATTVMDQVTSVGALSASGGQPARIKKDAYEVAQFYVNSSLAFISNQGVVGLPAAATEAFMSGGAKGATAPVDTVNALAQFQTPYVNSVVPLFSRDATADITDGLTDPGSTYTIAGIHQAVKTHISLMQGTKQKGERQGYMSFKGTYAACKQASGTLANARQQLVIQDVLQTNAQGAILWFQPWALACLVAGARGGASIGLPLTFKFLNCSGIRQTAQPMTTPAANIVQDFSPATQYDDAIQAGITFLEAPQSGGFRIVVDNTTYGIDSNFVFNRANVLYAADIVAYNFRTVMEQRYVGAKNTVKAAEVKSTAESVLNTFLAQGITVSTTDAPAGFKNLAVQINGNVINIQVVIKLVEGIDFVLEDITIQRASQSA